VIQESLGVGGRGSTTGGGLAGTIEIRSQLLDILRGDVCVGPELMA